MKKKRNMVIGSRDDRRKLVASCLLLGIFIIMVMFQAKEFSDILEKEQEENRVGRLEKSSEHKNNNSEKKIRILIKTNDFSSVFHKKIVITSSKNFIISMDGKEKIYFAGKKASFSEHQSSLKGKKIIIRGIGKLKVLSLKRQNKNPTYRGNFEVIWTKDGLVLKNEVSVEKYLYAVVPSELPTSNDMEVLKAQAICARTYIYNHLKEKRYAEYHADVDDSVNFQVYNNVPEDARSRKAVDTTKGMVITKNKKLIAVYYFSTSWGYIADGKDVWNTEQSISYLKGRLQITEQFRKKSNMQELDLSTDSAFEEFISSSKMDTYDAESPWYRWQVSISDEALALRIGDIIEDCYKDNPELVLTQTKTGRYRKKAIGAMGKIKKIRVEKREKSGLVTEIVIVGSKRVIKVCTQYNIRKVLAPIYEKVIYQSGTKETTLTMLPSAAFYVEKVNTEQGCLFLIKGGGMGHGTGMSQDGAAKMAELGWKAEEIIKHYYVDTDIIHVSKVKNR